MPQCVDYRHQLRIFCQILLLHRRYQGPQLVDVDDWTPLGVTHQVEATHTDFPKVTRMVLVKVGSVDIVVRRNLEDGKRDHKRTGDGVDHQQDHDHLGVCDVFLHAHDLRRRGHDACESW